MKKTILTLMFVLCASPAFAQAKPYCKGGPLTKDAVVTALRKNDPKVLNYDCMKHVESFNSAFKDRIDFPIETCEQLADYFSRLDVKPLPYMFMHVGRFLKDGKIDLTGFSRWPYPGELGLYDNQNGVYPISLLCCNPLPDVMPVPSPPTFTKLVDEKAPSIADSVTEAARKAAKKAEEDRLKALRIGEPNWFDRNKKWAVPTAVAVVLAVVAISARNETTVTVTVR